MPETTARPAPEKSLEPQSGFSDEALFFTDAPVPGPPRDAGRAGPTFTVRLVSDWTELEGLQESWQELASDAAEPNPFYEPWMLLPALRSFARSERVQVVLVSRGDRLCGLFPIAWRRGRAELLRHRYCYLTAPLLRRRCQQAAIRCWLDAMASRGKGFPLEEVPGEGCGCLHPVGNVNG